MNSADYRRLVTLGLTPDQVAGVMEMFDEKDEVRKAGQRARWNKHQKNKRNANVSQRELTTVNIPREGVTRVEDKTSSLEIEPKEESKGVAKSRPTRLPENFVMPDEWGTWAIAEGLPPERVPVEFKKLCNWAANAAGAKGAKSNWFKAWQNWIIEAIDKLPRNRGPTAVNGAPTLAQVFGMVSEKAAENEQRRGGGEGTGAVVLNLPAVRAQ